MVQPVTRPTPAVTVLLLAAGVLLLVACSTSASPPSAEPLPSGALTVELVAHGSSYDVAELRVRADEAFGVLLRNEDGDPHNFELRDAAGRSIFRGELFSGPAELLETVPALAAGRYSFLCTAHPYMKGTLLAD